MNSLDLVKMGLKNLMRRKLRTFLTVLGVIIGTASIVIMVSLGFGMKETFTNQIKNMGNVSIIDVNEGYNDMGNNQAGMKKKAVLDDATINKISKIDGVQAVTPILESYVRLVSGKYSADIQIRGIRPEVMKDLEVKIGEGRLLDLGDGMNIVFGSSAPMQFMETKNKTMNNYYPQQGTNAQAIKPKPKVNVFTDKIELTFDMQFGKKRPPVMGKWSGCRSVQTW